MRAYVFLLAVLVSQVYARSTSSKNDNFRELENAFNEFRKTRTWPQNFKEILNKNQLPRIFHKIETGTLGDLRAETCNICRVVAGFVIEERRLNVSLDALATEAELVCSGLNIESDVVCKGVINLNIEIFVYMIDNNPDLTGRDVCHVVSPECAFPGEFEWTVEIPQGNTVDRAEPDGTETFNILHISDFHYDPNYVAGKSNACSEPLCCQYDSEDGSVEDGTACGYWTDYNNADSPEVLVDEVFKQVKNHEYDYIYYTGDVISHRVWSTSKENNTRDLKTIFGKFRDNTNVSVFPVLGNHEPHPLNVWVEANNTEAEQFSTQWLFDLLADEWSQWLDEEATKTFLKGGFYTMSPRKGFRVIALNSNVAYTVNWWLVQDNVDPYGQLAWLASTLKKAEEDGESVHILYHVPSGSGSTFGTWSREYNKIVNRFANTITGQFAGHTHKDEFYVFYNSSEPTQAINVAWNGASVVPFSLSNPSYKLYNVDNETFSILDQEEWTFNLTEANLNTDVSPNWYQLYSFKKDYRVDSLDPESIGNLVVAMAKNHTQILDYHRYKFRDSPVRGSCAEGCQKNLLCSIVTSYTSDKSQCERISQIYDENN